MTPGRILLYVASASGLALLVRTFLIGPVPVWFAACSLGAYVVVLITGLLWTRLGMFGYVLRRGPKDSNAIAILLDSWANPNVLPALLELLSQHGLKVTVVFPASEKLRHPSGLAAQVGSLGHSCAIRMQYKPFAWPLLSQANVDDCLQQAKSLVEECTGAPCEFLMRPLLVTPRACTGADRNDLAIVAHRPTLHLDDLHKPSEIETALDRAASGKILLVDVDSTCTPEIAVQAVRSLLDGLSSLRLAVVPLPAFAESDDDDQAQD